MEKSHKTAVTSSINMHLLAQLHIATQKIAYFKTHDPLTSLLNRSSFDHELQRTIKNNPHQFHAVLLLDLDNFRHVFDLFGYEAHEVLLKQIAQRLCMCLHTKDLITRQESDKFIICFVNAISKKNVYKRIDSIFEIFTAPFLIKNNEFYLTASIGIATYPADGNISENLIHSSHTACHHAKIFGKNNCQFFIEKMALHTQHLTRIESQLHHALPRDEFSLHYQPQIDICSQTVIGVEALLRWNNQTFGHVSPIEFIPLAEKNGLILPISNWVIENACKQMKQWGMNLKPIQIAINISAQEFQLQTPTLIKRIETIIKTHQLLPSQIELELTESGLIKNYTTALPIMKTLRNLGVRIACDDFGTGYSSLTQLKQLPIDTLKIDKSFIDDITFNSNSAAIVQAIIVMAKKLNIRVIVEGVEHLAQVNLLQELGCLFIQGYYFSKPLPAHEMHSWMMHQ